MIFAKSLQRSNGEQTLLQVEAQHFLKMWPILAAVPIFDLRQLQHHFAACFWRRLVTVNEKLQLLFVAFSL